MSTATPISREERIGVLDTTRGIAVLGILLMNIAGFGLPYAYEDPTNWGGHEGANLTVWRINALFFEGTMRGLFTILFGAGTLLFLQRHSARDSGVRTTRLYYRRMLWLIAFGLLNGYVLLWDGDILFYYGVVGLVLFFFRHYSARRLLVAAAIVLALHYSIAVAEYLGYEETRAEAEAARAALAQGGLLTEQRESALEAYADLERIFKPTDEQIRFAIESIRTSYTSAFLHIAGQTWYVHTVYFVRHGWGDTLSFMLLGMALLRLGILSGEASTKTYVWILLLGYAVGITCNLIEIARLEQAGFSVDALMRSYLTYDAGRIPMTLAHVGLIMLLCRLRAFQKLARAFASVGQLALTNYLAQSLICMLIFTGAGLALYGQLERHELYYVVIAIWLLQLWWSPLWLQRYRFGPAEWVWRTLTYGRRAE